MIKYYLKKGTIVKHGTSLRRAKAIIEDGFRPSARTDVRVIHEIAPEQSGLYVGDIISYFGAYTAYTAELVGLMGSQQFMEATNWYFRNPKKIQKMKLVNVPDTLPVVLVIELEEDCHLTADEDFVYDGTYPINKKVPQEVLYSEAEVVWNKWRSGCIPGNIEARWIRWIEYPALSRVTVSKPDFNKNLLSDYELFAHGLLQSYRKELPQKLSENYKHHYGEVGLSNRAPATLEGIKKIENNPRFLSHHCKMVNHIALVQAVTDLCQQYGIQLH